MDPSTKGHQLFALHLDTALKTLLHSSVTTSLSHIDNGNLGDTYRLEIETVINLLYWYYSSIHESDRETKYSPAMKIFGLLFQKEKTNILMPFQTLQTSDTLQPELKWLDKHLPLIYIVTVYLFLKMEKMIIARRWHLADKSSSKYKIYQIHKMLSIVFRIAGISNTFLFLFYGIYPTMLHRISGLSLKPATDFDERGYSQSQLSWKVRQTFWAILTQTLGTALWVFDWASIQLFLHQYSRKTIRSIDNSMRNVGSYVKNWFMRADDGATTSSDEGMSSNGNTNTSNIDVTASNQKACACTNCGKSFAETPYISNCRHIYCYTCIYWITDRFRAEARREAAMIDDNSTVKDDGNSNVPAMLHRRKQQFKRNLQQSLRNPISNALGTSTITTVAVEENSAMDYHLDQEGEASAAISGSIGIDVETLPMNSNRSNSMSSNVEEAEERGNYLCPVCDEIVLSGERFSLK